TNPLKVKVLKTSAVDGTKAHYYEYDAAWKKTKEVGYSSCDYANPKNPALTGKLWEYVFDTDGVTVAEQLTFYASGNMESKIISTEDGDIHGGEYYHWNDDAGNTLSHKVLTADFALIIGTRAYYYEYDAVTGKLAKEEGYSACDYSDPKAPALSGREWTWLYAADGVTVVEKLTYYFGSGAVESKIIPAGDEEGNEYYKFDEEGRLTHKIRKETELDGTKAYYYEYHEGTALLSKAVTYRDAEYFMDPSAPYLFTMIAVEQYDINGDLTARFTYYDNVYNRMKTSELPDGTIYEYADEGWMGQGYGRLIKETKPDGTYKLFTSYFPGTNQSRYVSEYDAFGNLQVTYEYQQDGVFIEAVYPVEGEKRYLSGNIEALWKAEADEWGSVYYHFIDEEISRVDTQILAEADAEGAIAYYYEYHGDTSVISKKILYKFAGYLEMDKSYPYLDITLVVYEYDASGNQTARYVYYDNPDNRLKSHEVADGTIYQYSDEDWNGQGYGVLEKEIRPDGYFKTFSDYYTGTDQARFISEYDDHGNLMVTYEYSSTGALLSQTVYSERTYYDAEGRPVVYYDGSSQYRTYTWDVPEDWQVTVDFYSGIYDRSAGADISERSKTVVYYNNGVLTNLDTATNGWIRKTEYTYAAGGQDLTKQETWYYDPNVIESTLYVGSSDAEGRVYLHYYQERLAGRPDKVVMAEARPADNNAVAYYYEYLSDVSDTVVKVVGFSQADYTNVSDPLFDWSHRVIEHLYTYYGMWNRTLWYSDSGNQVKELRSTGEAKVLFDVEGFVTQTYWAINGNTTHYASAAQSAAGKADWYKYGTTLELYTYYDSGAMRYKDTYTGSWGNWTWVESASWKEIGLWDGWLTEPAREAPAEPEKPQRTGLESINLVDTSLYLPGMEDLSKELGVFYQDVSSLKESYSGDGVTIALLDSGVDSEVIERNILASYDLTSEASSYADLLGHGTKMARIISETAKDAEILDLKVFDDSGQTKSSVVSDAIYYAVDMGARVLSMSFSLFPISEQLEKAIDYAFSKGVVMVTAAGNSSSAILDASLAAQDKLITVGSVDSDGKFSAWNNYGSEIDLYAPWDVMDLGGFETEEGGTSYSAAFVTGLTALILEENPGYTAYDVLAELKILTSGFAPVQNTVPEIVKEKIEEDAKKAEIKGVSVDDVLDKYDTIRKNQELFSGHKIKVTDGPAGSMDQMLSTIPASQNPVVKNEIISVLRNFDAMYYTDGPDMGSMFYSIEKERREVD
ncbi:MAG: S8/S53 family peptidase, partial [Candidatus Omnitrophota bacterium]